MKFQVIFKSTKIMVNLSSAKQERISNGKKTASSTNGAGKIGQPHAENEIGLFPYTTHENRLKMDEGPQCEKGIHQNP